MTQHQWHQLKALSRVEWVLLFVSSCFLIMVSISLGVFGYGRTKNIIEWFTSDDMSKISNEGEMIWAQTVARLVRVAAYHGPVRFNCLTQALVLWGILGWQGILAEIRFGLHNEPGETFFAHAWVECNGINLIDSIQTQQHISAFI